MVESSRMYNSPPLFSTRSRRLIVKIFFAGLRNVSLMQATSKACSKRKMGPEARIPFHFTTLGLVLWAEVRYWIGSFSNVKRAFRRLAAA